MTNTSATVTNTTTASSYTRIVQLFSLAPRTRYGDCPIHLVEGNKAHSTRAFCPCVQCASVSSVFVCLVQRVAVGSRGSSNIRLLPYRAPVLETVCVSVCW